MIKPVICSCLTWLLRCTHKRRVLDLVRYPTTRQIQKSKDSFSLILPRSHILDYSPEWCLRPKFETKMPFSNISNNSFYNHGVFCGIFYLYQHMFGYDFKWNQKLKHNELLSWISWLKFYHPIYRIQEKWCPTIYLERKKQSTYQGNW